MLRLPYFLGYLALCRALPEDPTHEREPLTVMKKDRIL
jgi:hypothetical protein